MFDHPFKLVMIATFLAAVIVLALGVGGMHKNGSAMAKRAGNLMALRVALCVLLLVEILIYAAFIR